MTTCHEENACIFVIPSKIWLMGLLCFQPQHPDSEQEAELEKRAITTTTKTQRSDKVGKRQFQAI